MSFSSRHSPRFSYMTNRSPPPTETLGHNTFWQNERMVPQIALPHFIPPQVQTPSSDYRKDERMLISIIGVGIIAALLIDAIAHNTYSARLQRMWPSD